MDGEEFDPSIGESGPKELPAIFTARAMPQILGANPELSSALRTSCPNLCNERPAAMVAGNLFSYVRQLD
jgi:hypothetical protein